MKKIKIDNSAQWHSILLASHQDDFLSCFKKILELYQYAPAGMRQELRLPVAECFETLLYFIIKRRHYAAFSALSCELDLLKELCDSLFEHRKGTEQTVILNKMIK